MGKVIKVTNGTDTFDVNEDKLSLAVKDGYRPTERVIVANSKTGETYEVNPDKFHLALQDGFSFQDIVKKKVSPNEPKFGGIVGTYAPQSEESKIAKALQTVKSSPATPSDNRYKEVTEVAFDENDPVKSVLTPIENKLAEKRNRAVSSSTSTPVSRASESLQVGKLLNEKKQAENLQFDNAQQAIGFIAPKLDQTKLVRKGELDITKAPSLDDFTEESIVAAAPKDNMTVQIGVKKYLDNKRVKDVLANSSSFDEAAIKLAVENGDITSKQITALGGNVPASMKGNLVLNLLQNKNLQELAQEDQQLASKVREEIFSFPEKNPQTAVRILSQMISQKREDMGENNAILNITSAKTSDKIVDELVASGELPPQYKLLYEDPAVRFYVNKQLKTPGLVENFAGGLEQGVLGMGKTVADISQVRKLYSTKEDRLFNALDKQYSDFSFKPKGLMHQIGTHGGLVTGQVVPMMFGGSALKLSGLVNNAKTANAIMAGMQTWGENRDRALVDLPGESDAKQLAYATINTGIEVALSNVLNDTKLANNLIKKASPEIKTILTKFTNKEITEAAAKEATESVFSRLLSNGEKFAKGTLKTAEKEAREETATEILQTANNQVFGGQPVTVQQAAEDAFEVWRTTFLGSLPLGLGGGLVEVNKNPTMPKLVFEMASNPDKYIDIIEGQAAINPEYAKDVESKVKNLQHIVDVKKELDIRGMPEKQQGKFLLKSLSEQILNEKASAIPDKALKADSEKQLKTLEIEKQLILNPDTNNSTIVEEFYNEDLLPKGSKMLLENEEGKFSPNKIGEYLKFIAQQSNNLDENWQPHEGKAPSMESIPEAIKEIANERWKKEIEAANPPIDQIRELDMGSEPLEVSGSALKDVESTVKALDLEGKTNEELENIYDSLSKSSNKDVRTLANMVENVQEKNERNSILNTTLDNVGETVDNILKGNSYFLEKREAREAKEVAEKYLGEVSEKEAKKDFKDAFFGNPNNWVADALKMRESVRVWIENGGSFKDLLSSVQKEFEGDGFSEQEAALVIKNKLESLTKKDFRQQQLSEAYHKAKADGTNPELVKAVEDLLGAPNIQQGQISQTNTTTEFLPKETTPNVEDWSKDVESTAKALWGVQKENADKFVNDFANIDIPFRQKNIQAEMDSEVKKQLFPNEKSRRKYAETIYSAVVRSGNFPKILSEAYHKAKADGTNPELVKAVEDLLGKAPTQYTEAATPKVEGGQTVETTIPENESTQEATKATESKPTEKISEPKSPTTEDSGGAKEPPKTPTEGKGVGEGGSGKRDLDKLANNVPETGKVAEYMSKDSIIDATGEAPTNDQKRGVQSLEIALEHGEKIIDKAKELYGDDYVEKTLDYIENSTAAVSNKALMYVSLENALGKEKLTNPDKAAEITKKQALVYSKSQLFARENSKALNYNKLRNIAKVGYDVSKITDSFFSADELVSKNEISKAIEADADTINKEAELQETGGITPEIEKAINEGVAKEVQKIYEALPKEKKTAADRAIAALEKAQAKLRNKTYDAGLGIPVAFIDAGITTIKLAIKAGVKIADAIELGIAKIKEKYGKEIEKEREDAIRKDLAEVFDKAKSTKDLVKTILIEKGFGRKFVKKGETKVTLDWKKLAGAAGTTSKISENVADALKDKGYSAQEVNEMKDALINEYIDLRASVIEKAQNELARRNKETVTPEQKTAAKKLAELYTYGLFDAKIDEFENTLNKALGAKVSERGFQEAKDIAKAMDTIYSSTFKGVRLSDISAKAAIEKLEDRMRVLLFREAKKQGKWWNLGAANLVRNYFEIQQTMLLNNLKQAMENPFSGLQQNLIDKMVASGASTSEMATQRRKMMKDVYYDMILKGGVGYGKVESQFVNRQHIDDYVNKLSDKKLYHGIASALTGKATLNAMDAMFKAGITEKKFAGNLIKILTHSSNPNKMTREEAVKFVSEKLTGQTFDEAKETAKGIIEKINEDAGKELVSPNEYQVNRFANDIVKSALEMGNKITKEQIEAAYNAAYKAAGLGLGHEANNILSSTIKGYSAKLEGDINRAIKDKEFNRAAMLTYKSILFRNVLNPFVGGGTNWLVLKLEKTGLGLFTGLAYQIGSKGRIDVGSEIGMKRLEARLYNQSRYKDNYMRGLVGGMTSLLVYAAFLQLADEDEYRKWRRKNKWAAKYLDVITPEYLLAEMAAKDGKVKQYAASSFNKNDAFDASTKIIKAIEYFSKGDRSKGWGAMGEAMGQKINAPLPWRLVKDGQVIYQGVKGQDPYHGNYQPSEGFLSGVLQGGSIEYLGYRPVSPVTTMYTPEDMESPEIKFFIDKDVKMPSPNIDSKEIESSDGKTLMKLKDADKATQEKYVAAYKKYLKEGLLELKKGYIEVYQDSFGRVSIPSTEEGQKGKETILLKDLDQKQLQSVVSDLGGMATKKASEEVFPKN